MKKVDFGGLKPGEGVVSLYIINGKVSCIEEYFNVSFRKNRISITAAIEKTEDFKIRATLI